jgi:antitoxin ParD1/3/4
MAAKKISITLPEELATFIAAKMASGEYRSESEVICDGLRTLLRRDTAVENWLQNRVATAYDKVKANPGSAMSGDHVRGKLLRLVQGRNRDVP